MEAGLARRVYQKVVVTPIAQGKAQKTLRYPRQKRQCYADLQAQKNIEDGAELGGHFSGIVNLKS